MTKAIFYLVMYWDYEQSGPDSIWTTAEGAEAHVASRSSLDRKHLAIETFYADDPKGFKAPYKEEPTP